MHYKVRFDYENVHSICTCYIKSPEDRGQYEFFFDTTTEKTKTKTTHNFAQIDSMILQNVSPNWSPDYLEGPLFLTVLYVFMFLCSSFCLSKRF